jgi:CRP/FNR family transcriptional regulator, polysaccharide utilization system transcription regulator
MKVKPICEICKVLNRSYFSILKEEDLQDLKFEKSSSFYKRGQIIFQEDSRAVGVYCLNEGKVKLFKMGVDGREQILRFVTPGELFGYRSIIGSKHNSVTAEAIENSIVCFINDIQFFELIDKYPKISKSLIISLSNMLDEADSKMTSMAQKQVRERLAESLVNLVSKFNYENHPNNNTINLSREDLANMVGSATETVIRLLSEFKEDKMISIEGRKITLLNIPALKKVANIEEW